MLRPFTSAWFISATSTRLHARQWSSPKGRSAAPLVIMHPRYGVLLAVTFALLSRPGLALPRRLDGRLDALVTEGHLLLRLVVPGAVDVAHHTAYALLCLDAVQQFGYLFVQVLYVREPAT